MSPDAVTCIVKLRDQYVEMGEEQRAEQELDALVAGTMQELIDTGRYPMTTAGDAALARDSFIVLAKALPTMTNEEIRMALAKWHTTNDQLVDHDSDRPRLY